MKFKWLLIITLLSQVLLAQNKTGYYFINDTTIVKKDTSIIISSFTTPKLNIEAKFNSNKKHIIIKPFTSRTITYEQTTYNISNILISATTLLLCEQSISSYNKLKEDNSHEASPYMIRAILFGAISGIAAVNITQNQTIQYHIPENKILYKITF